MASNFGRIEIDIFTRLSTNKLTMRLRNITCYYGTAFRKELLILRVFFGAFIAKQSIKPVAKYIRNFQHMFERLAVTSKRTSFKSKWHISLVLFIRLFLKVNVNAIVGSFGPWQALLMNPKGRNACRDGFVNISQRHCSLRKPRAFRTRFVVSLLAYKTLSINRNRLELAIYIYREFVV